MRLLLDTSTCVAFLRDQPRRIRRNLETWATGEAGISAVVLAELEFGVELSDRSAQARLALQALLDVLIVLPWPAEAATHYGRIRALLRSAGKLIGPNDLLIAAHALALELPLMTGNVGEFRRVPELKVLPLPGR